MVRLDPGSKHAHDRGRPQQKGVLGPAFALPFFFVSGTHGQVRSANIYGLRGRSARVCRRPGKVLRSCCRQTSPVAINAFGIDDHRP